MSNRSIPELLEGAITAFGDFVTVVTPGGTFVEWGSEFVTVTGYTDDEIADLHPTALVPKPEREPLTEALQIVTDESQIVTISTVLESKAGDKTPYEFRFAPFGDTERDDNTVIWIGRDVSDGDTLIESHQTRSDKSQTLTVPIVEVWDGILLSTVTGKLNSKEAETFTDALLQRIAEQGASVAIIDITGADTVDTQTAQHLIDTIHAVKLMGGQTIITGLNPDISQTLVSLGIGFDVETQSSLQDGLETALEIQGVSIN